MAVVEQIAAVGDGETLLGVLLDQKNADAGFLDARQRAEQFACTTAATGRARARRASGSSAPTSCARPIATICRSPPLIVRTSCLGRSRSLGNKRQDARRDCPPRARARASGWAPSDEILLHGEIGENAAILRHQRDAGLHDLMRRAMRDVGPVHEHRRARRILRVCPAMARRNVLLPAPLAPSMTTISPFATDAETFSSARWRP